MATQQQKQKSSQKRVKSLRDVLPRRGFEYRVNQVIFKRDQDAYAFKMALIEATNNLHKTEVDEHLADLMKKAKEVQKPSDSDHTIAFEAAGRQTPWAVDLKKGIISELLLFLITSRERHIKFTHYRPNKVDPSTEGKLAKAIDEFIGDSPAAEPDEHWKETDELDPKIIDKMMERMRKGLGADWGASSSDEEMEEAKKTENEAEAEELGNKLGALKLK